MSFSKILLLSLILIFLICTIFVNCESPTNENTDVNNGSIYALIDIERLHVGNNSSDYLRARFDSIYAPDTSITPLSADSVIINGSYNLEWNSFFEIHNYSNTPGQSYLDYGTSYNVVIKGNEFIPDMNTSINFPACFPKLDQPSIHDSISFNNFFIEWYNSCGGIVRIVIMQGDSTGIVVVTDDDGYYEFTSKDLGPINGNKGTYSILMFKQNIAAIRSEGYDNRGLVRAYCLSHILVNLF